MGPEESNTTPEDQRNLPIRRVPQEGELLWGLMSMKRDCFMGELTRGANLSAENKFDGHSARLFRNSRGMSLIYATKNNFLYKVDLTNQADFSSRVKLNGPERNFAMTAFFNDGKFSYTIVGGFDEKIRIEKRGLSKNDKTKLSISFECKDLATAAAMNSKCDQAAVGFWGGKVWLFSLVQGTEGKMRVRQLVPPTPEEDNYIHIPSLDFTSDGSVLVVALGRKLQGLSVKASEKGEVNTVFLKSAQENIRSVSCNPWSREIAYATGSTIEIAALEDSEGIVKFTQKASFNAGSTVTSVCYDDKGESLWYTTADGRVGVLKASLPKADVGFDQAA